MSKWVSVWGNAMSIVEQQPQSYAKDITFRYPILIPMDGKQIRLTFDNFTGLEAVHINKITIAKSMDTSSIDLTTQKEVLFDGKELYLNAGEQKVSDPIDMILREGEVVTVSLYLKDFTSLRCGIKLYGPTSKSYYALSDQTQIEHLPTSSSREINWIHFLSQVDVLTEDSNQSVICFGDSITALAWPEYLQLFLMQSLRQNKIGVVRKAVSGSRVLREYNCLEYAAYGIKGTTRFFHETNVSSADTVIILHGINDLIHPVGKDVNQFRPWDDLPTSEELINGLKEYITYAKSLHLKVVVGTLLPIKGWRTYNEMRNKLREEVNEWIRTSNQIDTVIDFDLGLRDENDPSQLNPIYDSGDHLHPSDLGLIKMAELVMKELYS